MWRVYISCISTSHTLMKARLSANQSARTILVISDLRLEYEDDYEYEFKVRSTHTSKIFAL